MSQQQPTYPQPLEVLRSALRSWEQCLASRDDYFARWLQAGRDIRRIAVALGVGPDEETPSVDDLVAMAERLSTPRIDRIGGA